jgi:hypothetical protein
MYWMLLLWNRRKSVTIPCHRNKEQQIGAEVEKQESPGTRSKR